MIRHRQWKLFPYLVGEYPASPEARGALYEISLLGEEALAGHPEAYVDSVVADMAAIAEQKYMVKVEAGAAAAAALDTTITSAMGDSLGASA